MLKDVRYALRVLLHAKGWSFVVILSLALGIGANAAMFQAVNGAVIRNVPVASLWLVAFGILAGVGIAMAGGRVVSSLVFGLPPTDLTTMGAAAVILVSVAVFAGYLPARRASRVDPLVALRYE